MHRAQNHSFYKLTDMGGNGTFEKIRIWMDMDLAKRGGEEWVSKLCPVKGSSPESR